MSKILKYTVILQLVCFMSVACECNFEGFGTFTYFKNIQHCFIGTVIKIERGQSSNIFTFKVDYIYKGKFSSLVKVSSSAFASACGSSFELNKSYLVQLNKHNFEFHTNYCMINAENKSKEFEMDTMMLNLFIKRKAHINLPYMKGEVKNGKQNGNWLEGAEYGEYKNGKRVGIWKMNYAIGSYSKGKKNGIWQYFNGEVIYFKYGKFINSISYIKNQTNSDSVKVKRNRNTAYMYYPNGNIFKIFTSRKIVIYHLNGKIKEKVGVNKQHNLNGYIYKYDQNGNLIQKDIIENDKYISAKYYFEKIDS